MRDLGRCTSGLRLRRLESGMAQKGGRGFGTERCGTQASAGDCRYGLLRAFGKVTMGARPLRQDAGWVRLYPHQRTRNFAGTARASGRATGPQGNRRTALRRAMPRNPFLAGRWRAYTRRRKRQIRALQTAPQRPFPRRCTWTPPHSARRADGLRSAHDPPCAHPTCQTDDQWQSRRH